MGESIVELSGRKIDVSSGVQLDQWSVAALLARTQLNSPVKELASTMAARASNKEVGAVHVRAIPWQLGLPLHLYRCDACV